MQWSQFVNYAVDIVSAAVAVGGIAGVIALVILTIADLGR